MNPQNDSPADLRPVTVRIETDRSGVEMAFNLNSLSPLMLLKDLQTDRRSILRPDPDQLFSGIEQEEPEHSVVYVSGRLLAAEPNRLDILLPDETEAGLGGSPSRISFSLDEPDTVFLIRGGLIPMLRVFEEGVRHTSIYNTPFGTIELAICATKVRNRLLASGELEIEYFAELRGKRIETCRLFFSLVPNDGPAG